MPQPAESKELFDFQEWREKSQKGKLEIIDCISIWTDLCGFGKLLQINDWNLNKLNKSKVFELLNEVYSIAGRVFLPNVEPFPSDKILVLNDGIAKTVDLKYKKRLDGYSFLFFLRDSITNHHILLKTTERYGVGIRTIFAGGERVQYSPIRMTGESILYYDENNISEYGKKLLGTQFLYNPAEFQMNTAFAKAFTIDTLGSKESIFVNGLYIEDLFLSLLNDIPKIKIQITENEINIFYKSALMFRLGIRETLLKIMKGLRVKIYHIDKFIIYKEFDGEDLEVVLYKEKSKSS